MFRQLLSRFSVQLKLIESRICNAIGLNYNDFTPAFATPITNYQDELEINKRKESNNSILDGILGNGIVWGVPVSRRSLEVRLTRKLAPEKRIKFRKNIRACPFCLHFHEHHTVCPNCYKKVKEETEAMQAAIQEKLKLDPVEKEVAIVYDNGNKELQPTNKIIVEMKKPPPAWFSQNLLTRSYLPQETVSSTSVSTTVKPDD